MVARGLYDDRLLDFPINSVFWDLVLDRPISSKKLTTVDKDLGNAFMDFYNIISSKKKLISNNKNRDENLDDLVRYNNVKISEIGLTFNLPGYNDIELKRGKTDILVTVRNIEEYVSLVFEKFFSWLYPIY